MAKQKDAPYTIVLVGQPDPDALVVVIQRLLEQIGGGK